MTGQFYSLRLDWSQNREILERERESLKRGGERGGGVGVGSSSHPNPCAQICFAGCFSRIFFNLFALNQ